MDPKRAANHSSEPDEMAIRSLWRDILGLPRECRLLAVLHCIDRLDAEEISDELGLSLGEVETMLQLIDLDLCRASRVLKLVHVPDHLVARLLQALKTSAIQCDGNSRSHQDSVAESGRDECE